MGKTEEEIKAELEVAKRSATIDTNRRKLLYAQGEMAILEQEKKMEAIKILCGIVQKYSISGDDIDLLLESVPYI
jgi:hypothetical protein